LTFGQRTASAVSIKDARLQRKLNAC